MLDKVAVNYIDEIIVLSHIAKERVRKVYEYVRNNLSWEKYARTMEKIFEQTIAKIREQQE